MKIYTYDATLAGSAQQSHGTMSDNIHEQELPVTLFETLEHLNVDNEVETNLLESSFKVKAC